MAPPTYHNIPIGAHREPILGTDWQELSGAVGLCNRILDGSQQAIQDRGYATLATFFLTDTHLEIYEFRPPKTREQEQSILGSVLHKGTPALRGFAMSRMGQAKARPSDGPLGTILFPDLMMVWSEWFTSEKGTVLGRSELQYGFDGRIVGFDNRIMRDIDPSDDQMIVNMLRGELSDD